MALATPTRPIVSHIDQMREPCLLTARVHARVCACEGVCMRGCVHARVCAPTHHTLLPAPISLRCGCMAAPSAPTTCSPSRKALCRWQARFASERSLTILPDPLLLPPSRRVLLQLSVCSRSDTSPTCCHIRNLLHFHPLDHPPVTFHLWTDLRIQTWVNANQYEGCAVPAGRRGQSQCRMGSQCC